MKHPHQACKNCINWRLIYGVRTCILTIPPEDRSMSWPDTPADDWCNMFVYIYEKEKENKEEA